MPDTLTKQQIVRTINQRTGISTAHVSRVVETLLTVMTEQLAAGGRIEIQNFMVFEVKTRVRRSKSPQLPTLAYSYLQVRPGRRLRTKLQDLKRRG